MRNRCTQWRRALAANHLGAAALDIVDDDRHVAAGPVQMRLDHLKRERSGTSGIEGIAAALQDAHADRRGDPVCGRHHAESALDLRTRGEPVWIDEIHEASGAGAKDRRT